MTHKCTNHSTLQPQRKLQEERKVIVLGITGGIACGKSLVCRFFEQLGATVLSADLLAREAVRPGETAFKEIVAHFGEEILSPEGEIDRPCLAKRIFAAPTERHRLNQITHPEIARLANERIAKLKMCQNVPLIIYEAPLLFEAKAEDRVDLVLVVSSTPEQQLDRLMRRDALSREEAQRRISTQMPLAEKISRADFHINNDGTPEETQKRVEQIFEKLRT